MYMHQDQEMELPHEPDYPAIGTGEDISVDLEQVHEQFARLDQKIMRHCRNMGLIAFFTLGSVILAAVVGLPNIELAQAVNQPWIIPAIAAFAIGSYLFIFMGLFRLYIWRNTKAIKTTLDETKLWFDHQIQDAFDLLEMTSERDKIISLDRGELDTMPALSACQTNADVTRHYRFAKHHFLTRIRRRAARSGSLFLIFSAAVIGMALLAFDALRGGLFQSSAWVEELARAGDSVTLLAAIAVMIGAVGYMICEKLFVRLGYGYAEERLVQTSELAQDIDDGVYAAILRICGMVQTIVHKIAEPVEPDLIKLKSGRVSAGDLSAAAAAMPKENNLDNPSIYDGSQIGAKDTPNISDQTETSDILFPPNPHLKKNPDSNRGGHDDHLSSDDWKGVGE